jgi:hypothetical protein
LANEGLIAKCLKTNQCISKEWCKRFKVSMTE